VFFAASAQAQYIYCNADTGRIETGCNIYSGITFAGNDPGILVRSEPAAVACHLALLKRYLPELTQVPLHRKNGLTGKNFVKDSKCIFVISSGFDNQLTIQYIYNIIDNCERSVRPRSQGGEDLW
jgi:hypothetical protein